MHLVCTLLKKDLSFGFWSPFEHERRFRFSDRPKKPHLNTTADFFLAFFVFFAFFVLRVFLAFFLFLMRFCSLFQGFRSWHFPDLPILAFSFSVCLAFFARFSLLFCEFLLSFPRISRALRRGRSLLFWGDPRLFCPKKARIGGSGPSLRVGAAAGSFGGERQKGASFQPKLSEHFFFAGGGGVGGDPHMPDGVHGLTLHTPPLQPWKYPSRKPCRSGWRIKFLPCKAPKYTHTAHYLKNASWVHLTSLDSSGSVSTGLLCIPGFGAGLFSPSSPRNWRNKQNVLERPLFIFCAKPCP